MNFVTNIFCRFFLVLASSNTVLYSGKNSSVKHPTSWERINILKLIFHGNDKITRPVTNTKIYVGSQNHNRYGLEIGHVSRISVAPVFGHIILTNHERYEFLNICFCITV